MERFCIIAFDSTHHALSAEKMLKSHEVPVQMIPVPKEITAGCGFSLKMNEERIQQAIKLLQEGNVQVSGSFIVEKEGLDKRFYPYLQM